MKRVWLSMLFALCCSATFCAEPTCYRSLADHFYDNDKVIMQALSLHRVTESSWTPIVRELQRSSRATYSLVKQRARESDNNPLDPFQQEPAEKLLISTMLQVFQSVLNSYLITNPDGIRDMFEYIRRNQPLWQECFPPPSPPQQ